MAHIINQEAYDVATSRAIVANTRKTFNAQYDVNGNIASFLASNTWNDFYASLHKQLQENGKLSEKQVQCVLSGIAKQNKVLSEKQIVASKFEPIFIGCFTIEMLNDGTFKAMSSKNGSYMLGHFLAKTEKQAISKANKAWASYEKHCAMIASLEEI